MRPHINVVLTPEDQRTYVIWSRGVVTAVVLLAVVVVGIPLLASAITAPASVVAVQEDRVPTSGVTVAKAVVITGVAGSIKPPPQLAA